MMYCKLQKIYKSEKNHFYIDIDTSFKLNAINVLYGVSGAGKTSLLRLLSGLDIADKGTIKVNHKHWLSSKINLPIGKRNIAYVFQDYGLFPNMTVLQNIQFVKKDINQKLLTEILNTLEITELLYQKPNDLSGGQQQRVALARAIIQEPDFLFLDEPLTAIDETLRHKLQNYLLELQQKYKFTVIMVSHQLQEVLRIADYVCVLENGKIIKEGKPNILLKENNKNTLKGILLSVLNNTATVLIGNQQIIISTEKMITSPLILNGEVEFNV